jgi:hypothetical protein
VNHTGGRSSGREPSGGSPRARTTKDGWRRRAGAGFRRQPPPGSEATMRTDTADPRPDPTPDEPNPPSPPHPQPPDPTA